MLGAIPTGALTQPPRFDSNNTFACSQLFLEDKLPLRKTTYHALVACLVCKMTNQASALPLSLFALSIAPRPPPNPLLENTTAATNACFFLAVIFGKEFVDLSCGPLTTTTATTMSLYLMYCHLLLLVHRHH